MKLEMFFEKFDQFADAPNAVAQMRELVCQLAVQGKLVPQDRTEESAAVLLERISAARAALSANRRARDETDTNELDAESAPLATPTGWAWTTLGTVQVFTNGYAFKSEDYLPSGVGIIRMGELGANGEIDETNMKYVSAPIAQSLPDTFRVNPGDLLMGMSGSIGKLAINRSNKTYLLNQRVGRLEPILIEKAFLQVFLKTVEKHYLRISFGMAIKNLSTKQINETPFPLPPLAEQKRIVAKVDEFMALCDRLEAQQQKRETQHAALARASLARFADEPTSANLNLLFHPSYTIPPADLHKSILTLAVQGKLVPQDPNDEPSGDLLARIAATKLSLQAEGSIGKEKSFDPVKPDNAPFDVPESWQWAKLVELTELITKGSSPKWQGIAYVSDSEGVLFITSENVGNYRLRKLDDLKYVEERFNEIETRSILKRGDILMNLVGASIGRTAIYDLHDGANINQAVALIRLVGLTDGVCAGFLLHYLNSPFAIDSMLSSRVINAQPNISLTDTREFAVPVPPLAEQRRIVAKVDQLVALVDQLETQLAASRATAEDLVEAIVAELTAQE